MSAKKHSKLKRVFGIFYILVLVLYIVFLIGNFIPKPHSDDIWLFGTDIYVVDQNQAVVVDFSRQPTENDTIVCNIDGEKSLAMVESVSSSNVLLLSTTVDGVTDYYTTTMTYGVVTDYIPALGSVYCFLSSFWGILCIIILPCIVFLIYQICVLVKISRKNRKSDEDFFSEDFEELPEGFVKHNQKKFGEPKKEFADPFKPISRDDVRAKFDNSLPITDKLQTDKVQTQTAEPQNAELEKEVKSPFYDALSDLKFKMAFQDTSEVSKRMDETIEDDNEQLNDLNEYGMNTAEIEDGVEISMDPKMVSKILLRLKNDGSLAIITDNYTANIDMEIE